MEKREKVKISDVLKILAYVSLVLTLIWIGVDVLDSFPAETIAYYLMISGILILACPILYFKRERLKKLKKRSVEKVDGHTIENIFKEVIKQRPAKALSFSFAIWLLLVRFISGDETYPVFSLFFLLITVFIILLVKDIRCINRVKNGNYTVYKGKFKEKEIIEPSDGGIYYYVTYYFDDISFSWRAEVSEDEYQRVNEDDMAYLACFNDKKTHKAFLGFYETEKKPSVYLKKEGTVN